MKEFISRKYLRKELRSLVDTFLAIFGVELTLVLTSLLETDLTLEGGLKLALTALLGAVVRSILKVLRIRFGEGFKPHKL